MSRAPVIAQQLWFSAPGAVEVRQQPLAALQVDEVLVKTECSAVSAGTEMLVYRGQIPIDIALDTSLQNFQQSLSYPLQYGYAAVGRVEQLGSQVDTTWLGKRVFAFQAHASHFIAHSTTLIALPDDIETEAALFLANMETAVNLVQDGNPALGEKVAVVGQGIVGLLLTAVLAQFPLSELFAVDAIATRRDLALRLGATQALNAFASSEIDNLKQRLDSAARKGVDLVYEVSGAPAALNLAIDLSGFGSRLVIGSWYGNKTAAIALGGDAHRNRLNIITSQVSSIAPGLSVRWDKVRRFELAWQMIRSIRPQQLISDRLPLSGAAELYRRLDQSPDTIAQAVFTYPDAG
ncbi:MAG TPA: zinc-binding alcohol dehydrogenase [Cellvibrio sp.]|nr:zinc-binding alcohol dehydrogenase [Cellvibrio sp.]